MKKGTDIQGRHYLTCEEAKPGTLVTFDGDFTCIKKGARRIIRSNTRLTSWERLWVKCCEGHHYLDGQLDFDGGKFYVGVYPVKT